MGSALSTIVPIFIVIALGYIVRRGGLLSETFMASGNRLLYRVAIPCLLFHKIALAPFSGSFSPRLIMGCALTILSMSLIVFFGTRFLFHLSGGKRATFLQCCIHGNIGYIGLAVCYYTFDEKTFGVAGVLAGFFIITQNILSVIYYHLLAGSAERHRGGTVGTLLVNPIILSTLVGLVVSFFHIPLPLILDKTLGIVGRMALPTALLIIGGSLDMARVFIDLKSALLASSVKLVGLPLLGVGLFHILSVPPSQQVVGVTLLCAPSAAISYIMARELNGDPNLASSSVTTSTLLSLSTFIFWLSLYL